MRIAVFSDTHHHINGCIQILNNLPVDLVIHLGDVRRDVDDLMTLFPEIRFESVVGNNDFPGRGVYEKLLELDGHRIYLTHGHLYDVKRSLNRLSEKAQALGAEMALFGHTHRPYNQSHGSSILFNPGSAADYAGRGSYGIIETDEKKLRCDILPFYF